MSQLISALVDVVGPAGLLQGHEVSSRQEFRGSVNSCQAIAIVRPATTDEVSKVLKLCHEAGQPVVPLGGQTGLVKGALASSEEIILSLERMNQIENVDDVGRTMTVQAGTPLQLVQEAAKEIGLMFPLDLGARGSATIGGNIATNAGGNQVIRYGMMRDQVLGIEAVLADGTVISSLNRMIKNNAGYDLKQLFIGTEGTLGIVTRAVLRLRPQLQCVNSALLAVENFSSLTQLLTDLDKALGGSLSSFEVMWNDFYNTILNNSSRHQAPLSTHYPYYVLVESRGSDDEVDNSRFHSVLEKTFENGLVKDAVIAQSESQRDALWAIRDDIVVLEAAMRPSFTFDVSVEIQHMEKYVAEVQQRLNQCWQGARCVVFGHMGDCNLHLVISVGSADELYHHQVEAIVYGALRERGGSISAEHGIGLEKRAYLNITRSDAEITLMKQLKKALDPKSILNPGKIFTSE